MKKHVVTMITSLAVVWAPMAGASVPQKTSRQEVHREYYRQIQKITRKAERTVNSDLATIRKVNVERILRSIEKIEGTLATREIRKDLHQDQFNTQKHHLPKMELNKGVIQTDSLRIRVLDPLRGIYWIDGQRVHLSPKNGFLRNYRTLKKVLMKKESAASVFSLLIPQAHASDKPYTFTEYAVGAGTLSVGAALAIVGTLVATGKLTVTAGVIALAGIGWSTYRIVRSLIAGRAGAAVAGATLMSLVNGVLASDEKADLMTKCDAASGKMQPYFKGERLKVIRKGQPGYQQALADFKRKVDLDGRVQAKFRQLNESLPEGAPAEDYNAFIVNEYSKLGTIACPTSELITEYANEAWKEIKEGAVFVLDHGVGGTGRFVMEQAGGVN